MLFKHLLRTQGATFEADLGSGSGAPDPVTDPVIDPVTPPVTPPVTDPVTPPVSDDTARLVKDVMKHKTAARDAQAQLDAATARLAAYGDATPEEIAQFRADKAAAELAAAEARGEYDRIIASVREQAEAREAELTARDAAREAALTAAQARIDDLTVGRAFGDSKFISENTVLSPAKARKLYGEYVEINAEGDFVVYDKPKGTANRTPLVDAKGDALSFEAGIEKVIKADPDFDTIGRSKLKAGSGSVPTPTTKNDPKPTVPAGKSRIAAGLAARKGNK